MLTAYLSVVIQPPVNPLSKSVSLVGASIHSAPPDELTQNLRLTYLQGPSAPGETFDEAKKNLLAHIKAMPQWAWVLQLLPEKDRC